MGEPEHTRDPEAVEESPPPHGVPTVVLAWSLSPERAELLRMRLAAGGVTAFVADAVTAHAHPVLPWASGGVRVLVPEDQLEAARQVLGLPPQELELPADFDPGPSAPEIVPSDGVAAGLLIFLTLMTILPYAILAIWRYCLPAAFFGTPEFAPAFRLAMGLSIAGLVYLRRSS